MARVTVEDCTDKISNHYELLVLAAHRARLLSSGMDPLLPRKNDKDTVLALREIAEGHIKDKELREQMVVSMQKILPPDGSDNEVVELKDPHLLTKDSGTKNDALTDASKG